MCYACHRNSDIFPTHVQKNTTTLCSSPFIKRIINKKALYLSAKQPVFISCRRFSVRRMRMSIKFSPPRRINDRRLVVCCLNKSCNVILMSSQKCVLVSQCIDPAMSNTPSDVSPFCSPNVTVTNFLHELKLRLANEL